MKRPTGSLWSVPNGARSSALNVFGAASVNHCVSRMKRPTISALLSVAAMLTIAPIVAAATLVCWHPDRWGGSVSPLNIIVMAFFGLFTVALWPTYIPAIIFAPLLMRWVAAHRAFRTCPLPLLFGLSLSIGAVAGALTLSVICLIYRYAPQGD